MRSLFLILLNLLLTTTIFSQTTVSLSDLEPLDNTSWSGSLMYVNYSDGKEVTLRTTMQTKIEGGKIIMQTQYPDEPSANFKRSMKLKRAGAFLGSEEIIERINLENGLLKLVTKFYGKDKNKPATMFKTYLLGRNEFSITKSVKYKNSKEKFIRNRYTYHKI